MHEYQLLNYGKTISIICTMYIGLYAIFSDNVIAVIGISLATSLITTLVTLAIAYVVHRHFITKKKERRMSRDGTEMGIRTSFQVVYHRS